MVYGHWIFQFLDTVLIRQNGNSKNSQLYDLLNNDFIFAWKPAWPELTMHTRTSEHIYLHKQTLIPR